MLFWGDRNKRGILRTSINGTGDPTEVLRGIGCPNSVALNCRTGFVYSIDACTGAMKTSRLDGSNEETLSRKITNGFVTSAAMYSDRFFWTTTQKLSAAVKYTEMESVSGHEYFTLRGDTFDDVAIVHPSNQPPGNAN